MQDDTLMKTMLLDFYGELLTDKQREYYDLHYNSDLSLQEIAEQSGVSRQAVWDIIRRADAILTQTEAKTGFMAAAIRRQRKLETIQAELEKLKSLTSGKAHDICAGIAEKLQHLED